MAFFAMMILFIAFMRFGRFHRMRRWHRGYMYGWHPYRHLHQLRYAGQMPVRPSVQAQAPRESAFELLKRKYVKGEISDHQYESELDALLKTPEGRREIDA
jgi:hypothetical protein